MSETLHPINNRSTSVSADVMNHLSTKEYRHISPKILDEKNIKHTDPTCDEIAGSWRLVEEESALYAQDSFCPVCDPLYDVKINVTEVTDDE